ncbi:MULTISPECIES: hypothetical protein [Bradyrhizobium]|uniref:Oxidoreductase n=1 Tax=Bradyrhizobium japonicum TaxID=375 RepID=A0A1Y2JUI6_BRAJP|nr:hypothetical protein [Bradyrhizobium japonicum]OSJ35674.1 hypothetical protein BSZ19_07460 [Bradyrhizobium japonicum]
MKKIVLASACILALSTAGAFAQTNQPAAGASGQGEVGPSSAGTMKKGTTTGASSMKNEAGDSMGRQPARAGGTNTNNMGSQAGGGAGGGAGGK